MNCDVIDILDNAICEAKENNNLINIAQSYCENNSSQSLKKIKTSIGIIAEKQIAIINLLENCSNKLIREILKI